MEFSPEGNYLICDIYRWEWHGTNIYDVNIRKKVLELNSPFIASFTPNEKYFFACAQNDFSGEYSAKVYSAPDFKEIYDALAEKDYVNNIDCKYDEDKQVIRFTMNTEKQIEIVEISAITGEIKTINEQN